MFAFFHLHTDVAPHLINKKTLFFSIRNLTWQASRFVELEPPAVSKGHGLGSSIAYREGNQEKMNYYAERDTEV
jgi:hypothetical protein